MTHTIRSRRKKSRKQNIVRVNAKSTPKPSGISRNEWLVAAAVYGLVLVFIYFASGITPNFDGRGYDGRFYAAMSHDETRSESFIPIAPYCYRVLTPLLVAGLPGNVVTRFRVFNLIVWVATLLVWHRLARRTGLSVNQSLFGGMFLACSAWGPMFAFYSPCYIDPLMYFLILTGLNFLVDERWKWLAVLLPIAMLQRELCLIVWICALAQSVQRYGWSRRRAIRLSLMLIPCGVIYMVLHMAIHPTQVTTPAPWRVIVAVAHWLITDPSYLLKSILAVLYTLGVPLIGFALIPEVRRYAREHRWMWYYLIFSALALLGGSDKGRLIFLAQPVLIVVFLHGLARMVRIPPWRAAFGALLLIHLYVQWPPALMISNGRLQAPLVDAVERGTHGASIHYPAAFPIHLTTVAIHLSYALVLAGLLLITWRIHQQQSEMVSKSCSPGQIRSRA